MNWDAIGAIGEVIGGFAVLVTLVYLARQVRSAEKMMQAETRNRRLSDIRDFNLHLMQFPEIIESLNRVGNTLDDSYDQQEYLMWQSYIGAQFTQFHADYELFKDGVFSDEDLDRLLRRRFVNFVRQRPRTSIAWERVRDTFPEDFAAFMDEELRKVSPDGGA